MFLFLKTFCRLKVYGQENIPKTGAFILAANHVSYLDPLAVGVAANREVNFMARHDLFSVPILGWWMSNVKAFPVKRDTADISALKEAIRRLRRGEGLVLFPEGRRSPDGEMLSPEAGVGFIAAKSQAIVIPVFVKGTDQALPKGAKFIKPHKISVYFGAQIHLEKSLPYGEIAASIMSQVRHLSS